MYKIAIFYIFLCFSLTKAQSQTTDLAIVVEAQNLSGNPISQIDIYQEFQYIVTIINSGNAVSNATFSQTINTNATVLSFTSQNNSGGATDVTGLSLTGNVLTGTIANLPNNSSVEVKVVVKAPLNPGGIATNVVIIAPDGTTDTNISNNQSIISIDVNDVIIDFTIVHSQVSPTQGTGITAWNDTVTYEFTITNNSAIDFPLIGFLGKLNLDSDISYGVPVAQFESISCIGGTSGMTCPTITGIPSTPTSIITTQTIFTYNNSIEFTAGGSLTFQVVYRYLDPLCGFEFLPLAVNSFLTIAINHINNSSNNSNSVLTPLIEADLCQLTDICIQTTQITPAADQMVNWDQQVTFVTTVCNNGPLEVPIRFFLQNLSVNINWDIISITCNGTTGAITCNDFTLIDQDQFWGSTTFNMPVNTTIEVTTVVIFIEPETCSTGSPQNSQAHVRSGTNLLSNDIFDSDLSNNAESDFVILPPLPICDPEDVVDLLISKTQISPALPEGGDILNTTGWGEVTYEIVATNPSDIDAIIEISDFMPQGANQLASATLISVECVSTTGTASCFTVNTTNIGVLLDGEPEAGVLDTFWEILPEDNWVLPAQSSVTFNVIVDWQPDCSDVPIKATNRVSIASVDDIADNNEGNNTATVETFFAPCIDLIVQTYPQFTSATVNQTFNWIVDITNSNTSSNALNIDFQDILGPQFTITGTPTCAVVSGSATCISTFNINGNTVTGNIVNMDAASTIQIIIPVTAPNFGGAFTNTAEAIPNPNDNEELTPETNISISNIQIIAPIVEKTFTPDEIIVGQQSILEFTVTNISGNPAQTNIGFTDNLPLGLTVDGVISWVQDNGCTATFTATIGSGMVSVSNLNFPSGVANCTFSIPVTSNIAGSYLNSSTNFIDQNNIDASSASATLNVLPDTSNVDIAVLKTVTPSQASIGDTVLFTITATNVGTTTATNITLFENLPLGYNYVSSTTSLGSYDSSTYIWDIPTLNPNQSENLSVSAQIISSNNLLNTANLLSLTEIDRDETNNEDSAEVNVDNCLVISKGFSPNNDGDNDVLVIPCIEDYPENNIKIYNRYGTLVFETNNYKNNWNGIPNQGFPETKTVLPTGTYYYVLQIDSIESPFVSWIYLIY